MTFDRKKYKSFALMQLKGRWKTAIFATIISIILLSIFSVTQKPTNSLTYQEILNLSEEQLLQYIRSNPAYSAPGMILSLIYTIINFIVKIVLAAMFIIYSRSPDPVTLKNYFEGYNKWGRGVLIGLWQTLWLFLWALIAVPVFVAFALILTFIPVDLTVETISTIVIEIIPILMLVCFIPMFIKAIEYSFAVFFTAEFPELGIRKALRLSITLAKGHRWEIFKLDLSFVGWFLLSICTFMVGFLWSIPYYYMTYTNTYHALLQDALEKGKILPEDLE